MKKILFKEKFMKFSKFDFLKYRTIYIMISVFLLIFSVFFLFFGKMNLGIDMTGGINLEYSYKNDLDIEKVRKEFEKEKETLLVDGKKVINNINIYSTTGQKNISVVVGFIDIGNESKIKEIKDNFREKSLEIMKLNDNSSSEVTYSNIGKSFGDYIKTTAYLTLTLAIFGMFFYIYYTFSGSISGITGFSFGFITLLTLFHDVLITAGIFIFSGIFYLGFQVDTYFITALLTILGYSINDTIVIFDRIRDNLKKFAGKEKNGKDLYEIVNLSVIETFKRSIFTSLTLVFVLITILFFGPETLQGFIYVMLIGTIIGTYSSIFIASPLFYEMNKKKKLEVYKEKVYNPDDKIVV